MELNLLRTLSDNTLDLIYAKDLQGRFIFANLACGQMMGVSSPDDLLGKTDFDFYPKEMAQGFFDDEQVVIRSGQPLVGKEELVINATTQDARWHSTTKIPLRDNAGFVVGIMGINRDITANKLADTQARQLNVELEERVKARTQELQTITEELVNKQNLMRTLVDSLPDGIYAKDIHSKFLLANQSLANHLSKEPSDLIGKDDFDFFPPEVAQQFFDDEQKLLETGQSLMSKEEFRIVDGKNIWTLTTKVPVLDDTGATIGLVGIGRDITRLKEAELGNL